MTTHKSLLKILVLRDNFFQQSVILGLGFFILRFQNQDNRGGSLGLGSNTQFHSASNIDVWDVLLFAQNGDMGDNINGANITSQNTETIEDLDQVFMHFFLTL